MPFDHSEFIEKYKNPRRPESVDPKERAKSITLGLIFITLYLVGCYALAGILGVDKITMLVAGLAFIIAGIAGYWLQQVLFSYKRREKELKLLREVLEGSRGARLITDSADNAIYANQRFDYLCQPYGPPSIETLSMLFSDNPAVANHFSKLAEQAYRGLTDSMELVSKEGEGERWFLVTAQPVAGWAGFVHWRVDDITEARDLNRSVREEREKLIDFTDNAPVGFFSVNGEGRFVFVNATLARWLGDSIEHLLTKGRIHTYLETPPEHAAPYDVLANGGARQVAEITMKGPGGQTFLASINMAVVRESDGRVRTRGVVHDLTSEREMRQALQASEDRFQKFFDEAPVGVMLIGSDGKIKDGNAAMASLIKVDLKSLENQNQNLKDLIIGDNSAAALRAIEKIEKGRRMAAPMEVSFKVGDHAIVTQMHGRRFKNSDDIVLHFIDLTEQKDLEVQFVQSQKMQAVGQLAGGIAHDFNNLLTAIIGFSDLLMLRHKPGDPSFGDIMQIKQNSNRAANLVRQLLAFSRQQTLRPKIHDITDILTELSHLIRRLIGANIELDVMHGSDLGLIKVDVGQMEQVLINLAVNARDAMDGGGKLVIKTDNYENKKTVKRCDDDMPPGRWLTISVTDTGSGISSENMSRILEPFFTTKGVGEGTGLGLATVYGIIRQTGGYLDIKTKIGEGTTFTIYLPVLGDDEKQEDEVDEKKDETPTDLTGTARILLVEDEEAVRAFSTRALINKGYDVIGADCGESALSVLEKEENKEIDLLITDVMMPNMDGPTLAQRLRQLSPELKIIFISGYSEDKLKEHMGEGISFLPKPFTLKQLAAKVKEALTD